MIHRILLFAVLALLTSHLSGPLEYVSVKEKELSLGSAGKKEKKKKKKKKKKKVKSNCDPKSLVRTTDDSLILKKYVDIYKGLGGVCYIRKLQKMAKLEQTSEGYYSVKLGKAKTPQERADWQTYLFCPIGKPNGMVALVTAEMDTIQLCSYKNERKEGFMYWLKPRYGVVNVMEFENDERKVLKVPDYDGGYR